jgi:hypothetical protein
MQPSLNQKRLKKSSVCGKLYALYWALFLKGTQNYEKKLKGKKMAQ